MKKMKSEICLFGGTFNPVHNGHILTCNEIKRICGFKKIVFIPNYIPPHREKPISVAHRFKMLELALSGTKGFELSDFEMKRKTISYFYDTLRHFKREYNNIAILIGSDQANRFRTWYKWQDYFDLAEIITVFKNERLYEVLPFNYIKTSTVDISSRYIRHLISKGLSVSGYIDPQVEEYIHANRLYR